MPAANGTNAAAVIHAIEIVQCFQPFSICLTHRLPEHSVPTWLEFASSFFSLVFDYRTFFIVVSIFLTFISFSLDRLSFEFGGGGGGGCKVSRVLHASFDTFDAFYVFCTFTSHLLSFTVVTIFIAFLFLPPLLLLCNCTLQCCLYKNLVFYYKLSLQKRIVDMVCFSSFSGSKEGTEYTHEYSLLHCWGLCKIHKKFCYWEFLSDDDDDKDVCRH